MLFQDKSTRLRDTGDTGRYGCACNTSTICTTFQRGKLRVMITPKWMGFAVPIAAMALGKPHVQHLVEYIHWIHLNTCYTAIRRHRLQGTSIASWCPPCQVRNELSVGLMWQVHPPKQIETVVASGDQIHQIAQISVVCHHLLRSDCQKIPIVWTKQCWDL